MLYRVYEFKNTRKDGAARTAQKVIYCTQHLRTMCMCLNMCVYVVACKFLLHTRPRI